MVTTQIKHQVAEHYFDWLSEGKIDKILSLFTLDAIVHSPVYGKKRAADFYSELGDDTKSSELKLNGFFDQPNSNRFVLYFNYKWTLTNGKTTVFDVVDVFELNEEGKIIKLNIIYNASESTPLINELNATENGN
ncbi:nuclear transport factor 2 family protein [Allomuricauda sp. d1]|uniref:nuclear transport factor 2 family protein n=1 Tax=Allomuricauda sp. d1 TaxID=3136725 RepID=UPI0031D14A82